MTQAAQRSTTQAAIPNDLEAFWMPFTANRAFKARPRMVSRAKNMHYYTPDGRAVIDGAAGLWCTNAGHSRDSIVAAIQAQAAEMDFAPPFQYGNPKSFELASRLAALAPADLDHVFFCNSGSEAVDTAMKIALAYWNVSGQAQRVRFIGRERGYHGVGFGGMSVGGIGNNRKAFGTMLGGVDHLPHTYNREHQAFSRGEPDWGEHLADDLERLVALHGDNTIAAVFVEPMAGSTAVLPAPKGYLKRLRAICDRYNILLVFDEVITGFGRLGHAFAAERYGVVPDMITFAKGVTSGAVPMGGVLVRKGIYDAFMNGPEHAVEFFHGYTYSAHPTACAAGLATLDIYKDEGLLTRGAKFANYWRDALHVLKGLPNVIDIRNVGLMGAVELAPRKDAPGARGYEVMVDCFNRGLYMRTSGDAFAMSPPLIVERSHIDEMMSILSDAIKRVA